MAPDYAVADVAGVADLFTTRGRSDLIVAAGSDRAVVGPVYVQDWADADLVIGSCLVDVKASVNPTDLNPMWIWQLCCYAWLDGHVDTIAIHLARQARTVAFDLYDTVEILTDGEDPALIAARGRSIMVIPELAVVPRPSRPSGAPAPGRSRDRRALSPSSLTVGKMVDRWLWLGPATTT